MIRKCIPVVKMSRYSAEITKTTSNKEVLKLSLILTNLFVVPLTKYLCWTSNCSLKYAVYRTGIKPNIIWKSLLLLLIKNPWSNTDMTSVGWYIPRHDILVILFVLFTLSLNIIWQMYGLFLIKIRMIVCSDIAIRHCTMHDLFLWVLY